MSYWENSSIIPEKTGYHCTHKNQVRYEQEETYSWIGDSMNKMLNTIIVCLATILMAACAPSPPAIQTAMAKTQAAWTPIPSQTAYPTYTPVQSPTPIPSPSLIGTLTGFIQNLPEVNPQDLIHEYTTSSYRVISLIQNPYAPYILILVTERAPIGCGSPDAPSQCTDDTNCGSLYTSPTCYFFVEPKFVYGAESATRFVASWSGGLIQLDSIHFLDAQSVEFHVEEGDYNIRIRGTYHLDTKSGEITEVHNGP